MDGEELRDKEIYKNNNIMKNEESNDSSSSYSKQPNHGNKFFNNQNSRKKNDIESSKENNTSVRQPNTIANGTNSLNKKIRSQAKEKPKQVNLAKPSSKNPKDFLRNSVNKAKNTISSIHNNKNSRRKDSTEDNNPLKNGIGNTIKKNLLPSFKRKEETTNGIGNILALNKMPKSLKFQLIISLAPIIIVLFIILTTSLDDSGGTNEESSSSFASYGSGEISDEQFYESLVSEGLVAEGACIIEETEEFNPECTAIKFFKAIKDGTSNQIDSNSKFLMIFYAISYNRDIREGIALDDEIVDFYDYFYNSEELNALIDNSSNLKEYLNNDYITTYRSEDIDKEFDLYAYVSELAGIYSQSSTNVVSCKTIILDEVSYGEDDIRNGIVLDLDEYVAGVVKNEIGYVGDEVVKAQAIAARTYAYYVTDRCTKPMSNTSSEQTFTVIDSSDETDNTIVNLVNQVTGIIIQDSDGNIISDNYGSLYSEEIEGLNYEQILKKYYGESIVLNNLVSEFFFDEIKIRISRATRDNKFFYDKSINAGIEGECPWYANGRAMEFLDEFNVKFNGIHGNGRDFCKNALSYNLKINSDIDSIEPGSLISWDYCQAVDQCYGHVAFVEKVNRNSNGDVDSIEVTEGGIGFYKTGAYITNNSIVDYGDARKYVNDGNSRQTLCEANGTGCQNYRIFQRNVIAKAGSSNASSFCTIPLSQLIK